jgi:isopentenyldiphosphate isomerase
MFDWVEHPMAGVTPPGIGWLMRHSHSHHEQRTVPVSHAIDPVTLRQAEKDFVPSPDEVARRAYFAYENEGSLPGHDVQHWLTAEAELIQEREATRTKEYRR